jgi:hypothetical protein
VTAAVTRPSKAEIARGWARKDLSGQVRSVARRLSNDAPRRQRLLDLALDLELTSSDREAAPIVGELREVGLKVAIQDG